MDAASTAVRTVIGTRRRCSAAPEAFVRDRAPDDAAPAVIEAGDEERRATDLAALVLVEADDRPRDVAAGRHLVHGVEAGDYDEGKGEHEERRDEVCKRLRHGAASSIALTGWSSS